MNLIGDVKGKVAVMVDDMIDTAGEHSFLFNGVELANEILGNVTCHSIPAFHAIQHL